MRFTFFGIEIIKKRIYKQIGTKKVKLKWSKVDSFNPKYHTWIVRITYKNQNKEEFILYQEQFKNNENYLISSINFKLLKSQTGKE